MRVTGKGGAVRDCPLPPEVATILEAYITTRHERTKRRAGRDAPVWLNGRGKPLTPSALDHHVRRKGHIKRKARQCALRRTAGSKVPSIPYLRSGMEPCGEPVTPPDARVGRRRPSRRDVWLARGGDELAARVRDDLDLGVGVAGTFPLAFLGPFVDCGAAAALYLAAEDGFLSARPATLAALRGRDPARAVRPLLRFLESYGAIEKELDQRGARFELPTLPDQPSSDAPVAEQQTVALIRALLSKSPDHRRPHRSLE